MEKYNNLSENLKAYQDVYNLSLMEFSKELDIPKSTLRSILKEGNTTLETSIHISHQLNISLDLLVFNRRLPDKLFILYCINRYNDWVFAIPADKTERIVSLMEKLWEVLDS